jgi:hypothetical protein
MPPGPCDLSQVRAFFCASEWVFACVRAGARVPSLGRLKLLVEPPLPNTNGNGVIDRTGGASAGQGH